MVSVRVLTIGLALASCLALAAPGMARGGRVVVAPVDTRAPLPAAAASDLEPAFLAHMTADDVARGVYGLAAAEGAVELTPAQRAALGPLLREGAELRARLGELRMERRAARDAWLADGAALAAAVGPLPPEAGR